ncbi:MAG TPA: hypothetical protein VFE58_12690 [Tepidisphaeraceae bacterium]|jgi:hypothetical protein|nr:hypothetical protein [Tepidisphaeraceae bacterium]
MAIVFGDFSLDRVVSAVEKVRQRLLRAAGALDGVGFVYRHTAGLNVFLDGPEAKAREGVHVIFANEKVRENEVVENPDVMASESAGKYQVLSLDALVQLSLSDFRSEDRMHLRDMFEVGIIDEYWVGKFHPEVGARLQSLLDDPNG